MLSLVTLVYRCQCGDGCWRALCQLWRLILFINVMLVFLNDRLKFTELVGKLKRTRKITLPIVHFRENAFRLGGVCIFSSPALTNKQLYALSLL